MTQATPLPSSSASSSSPLQLRVIRLDQMMLEDRGWTRGHATLAFDDHPKTAPGYLDFGDLVLAVTQTIDPGGGYPMHPHREIETITLVQSGAALHSDNLGSNQIVRANEVSVLSAGSGIEHAEMTHGDDPLRIVMFSLRPSERGAPQFRRRFFDPAERQNRWALLASGGGEPGTLPIRHDARIHAAILDPGVEVEHRLARGRRVYLVATDAPVEVSPAGGPPGILAGAGDRVLAEGSGTLRITAHGATEVVLLDFA